MEYSIFMVLDADTISQQCLPKHVAIIMDGNGRWAQARNRPRVYGHKKGVDAVRQSVQFCTKLGIQSLTLFAFSSENWRRPEDEVNTLMELFLFVLSKEVKKLHKNNVKLNDHAYLLWTRDVHQVHQKSLHYLYSFQNQT